LKVRSYTWSDQLYMYGLEVIPSKADYGYTSGVFGNSNGNPDDDIEFNSYPVFVYRYASDAFLEKFK
jgi:hypothetical protein